MSRRNGESVVKEVLQCLNNKASSSINQNKQLVNKLVAELICCLHKEEGTLKGATIRHCGSAYENLGVKNEADFDLVLELGEPFVGKNFEIIQDFNERFVLYTLKKKNNPMILEKDVFCSRKGNLKTEELRSHIFERLKKILSTIKVPGVSVTAFPKLAAMQVNLCTSNGQTVDMDLTPQIVACTWKNCPGLVPVDSLPHCLTDYIASNSRKASPILFFTPAVLNAQRSETHEICNMVSFSLLEKHFLKEEAGIHDMVRLAKLVKENQNWTGMYGLKSFHLKRLAIKNADTLRTMTVWSGFRALLKCLAEELEEQDGLTDCFVEGHFIYYVAKPSKVKGFLHALGEIMKWEPERLKRMV